MEIQELSKIDRKLVVDYNFLAFRKDQLLAISDTNFLLNELETTKKLIISDIKSFQLWSHLTFLLQAKHMDPLQIFDSEFCRDVIDLDVRSYYLMDLMSKYVSLTKDFDLILNITKQLLERRPNYTILYIRQVVFASKLKKFRDRNNTHTSLITQEKGYLKTVLPFELLLTMEDNYQKLLE